MKVRFIDLSIIAIVAVFVRQSNICAQEKTDNLEPGQKEFLPIDSKTEELFVKAIQQGTLYYSPEEEQIYPAENQLSDVWVGNRPILSASISEIKLNWQDPAPKDSKQDSINFYTDLIFSKDSIVIKHSRQYFPNQVGGIRVPLDPNSKVRSFWYRGRDRTSLMVIVPRFSPNERDRGIMLCPRDFFEEGSRSEKTSLRKTNLKIVDAIYKVDGEARGELRNAVAMGLARASINVSQRIVPSVPFVDEISSKISNVAVFYKAAHLQFNPRIFDFKNLTDGIEVGIEMQLPTGFKRYSRYRDLVYIKEIIHPSSNMRLQAQDAIGTALYSEAQQRGIKLKEQVHLEVKVDGGACYLVLNERGTVIHHYLYSQKAE